MIWLSSDLRFKRFWLSIDLRFKWFGCQSMCASNDFGCLLIWTSSDVVVNWFGIQVIRLSIDLRFKWFGGQSIWDSNELVVNWFEIQVIWMSNDLRFKWFGCQLMCDSNDFVKRSFSARLPSKTKLWRSKTKLFCETSFKIEALKLKNEAILRDFLQNWSFEAQKRSFSARFPSKLKLWSSKMKLFCETSFKNDTLKLKNEAFLRDFLQKWSFEAQKTKLFCETSFKNDMSTGHLTSELQYVLAIFNCMLQKYCACHEKVAPRHTNSCNCHAKWSLQSNTSVTWNLQPFHGFSVGGFKHRHHKARNHCACHAKRIVPDPLEIHHACQRFCNPHELLRLPRILQRVKIPAPATRNTLWTSKNVPRPSVFNDFDFQIALAQAWCNFCEAQLSKARRNPQVLTIFTAKSLSRAGVVQILSMSTSKSAPTPPVFNDFDFQIALARRRGANFVDILGSRSFATPVFRTYLCEPSKRQNYGKTQHFAQFLPAKTSLL